MYAAMYGTVLCRLGKLCRAAGAGNQLNLVVHVVMSGAVGLACLHSVGT